MIGYGAFTMFLSSYYYQRNKKSYRLSLFVNLGINFGIIGKFSSCSVLCFYHCIILIVLL
jgi:hypothetical protein